MQSYKNLLKYVLENGEEHSDRTGVGTKSVFGYQWRHNMKSGFPLLTTKKVPLRWAFEELKWMLSGDTNNKTLLDKGVDIWQEWSTAAKCAKFGRQENDLGPIYGWQWRHFGMEYYRKDMNEKFQGIDQIKKLLTNLVKNPYSRRHILTLWNPMDVEDVELPPCHTLCQLKVHPPILLKNELSLHLYARSIDSFLGLPFDIAFYGLLLEMLAKVCNYTPRDLIISFGDLHIYNNHLTQVNELLSRTPSVLPVLNINYNYDYNKPALDNLLNIQYDNIELLNYNPQSKIQAPVAV